MKILIVVGFVVPKAAELIGEPKVPYGGWVTSLIDGLKLISDIDIAVAMKSYQKKLIKNEHEGITYYFLPSSKFNKIDVYETDCVKVLEDFKPTLIHAEGAEVFITYRFFSNYSGIKIISIKGIFSDIQKYEDGNITSINYKFLLYKIFTFYSKKFRYQKRKLFEQKSYLLANYVIGRTLYDKSHSFNFNRELSYFHINESLRNVFYLNQWNFEKCEKYSIFIGNGSLARKGSHIAIEALRIIIKTYPNTKLYIVNGKQNSLKDKLTYKGFINYLIRKYHLENNVVNLGALNENEMTKLMLKCHVYLLPSFVENSSNTLGEAMIMGMPCVVSYCGGVSSLAEDENEVLFYRPTDEIMLSYQILRIFSNEIDIIKLGKAAKSRAEIIYDHKRNTHTLISVYNKIIVNETN